MKRILVVEDDPEALKYLSTLLSDWGYEVREATNGPQALSMIREECPDVVISDLVMPGMDGDDLLRQVRLLSPDCTVQFIMLTGKPTVSRLVGAVQEGADDVLLKPLDPEKLREVLLGYSELKHQHKLRRDLVERRPPA